jgi:acetyl-CoA carboxylase biotin carboxyl carrier protein
MDLKQIQELIKMASKSGISELTVKEGEFEITIKTESQTVHMPVQHYVQQAPMQQVPMMQQHTAPSHSEEQRIEVSAPAQEAKSDNHFTFKSPMIGTFYRKPGPDKPLFVQVGDSIKKGDVLCIIEAMKLFNEIEYDGDNGKVVKILVDDSSPVEYDQPLFVIEKA